MDFFRMTLTTPASASPPYTADDPTGTTSMRSTAAIGIRFRLKMFPDEAPTACTRRPLINTKVEPKGSPRSCTEAKPNCPLRPPSPIEDASFRPARKRCSVGCPLLSMSSRE